MNLHQAPPGTNDATLYEWSSKVRADQRKVKTTTQLQDLLLGNTIRPEKNGTLLSKLHAIVTWSSHADTYRAITAPHIQTD
jgi:hypothetical protein